MSPELEQKQKRLDKLTSFTATGIGMILVAVSVPFLSYLFPSSAVMNDFARSFAIGVLVLGVIFFVSLPTLLVWVLQVYQVLTISKYKPQKSLTYHRAVSFVGLILFILAILIFLVETFI